MSEINIYYNTAELASKLKISSNLLYVLHKRSHPNLLPKSALNPHGMPLWDHKTALAIIENFKTKGIDDAVTVDNGFMYYPGTVAGDEYYLYSVAADHGSEMVCIKSDGLYTVHDYQGKMWKTSSEPVKFKYANQLYEKCKKRKDEFEQYRR